MRCGWVINCRPTSPLTLAEVFLVMKTMRCGFLSASEANPASYLVFSAILFSLYFLDRQAAVLLHSPEVDGDKDSGQQRQYHAVQHVETEQGVLPDQVSPQQQVSQFHAQKRHGG